MSDSVSKSGHVYLLSNPAMPGIIKVGFTTVSDIEVRLKQLYSTGVPVPFECVYSKKLDNYKDAERALHTAFAGTRINPKREFFRIDPACVMAILDILPGVEEDIPDETATMDKEDVQALNNEKKRRDAFRFSKVGIKPGTVLNWRRDEAITCTVYDDRAVLFEGQITSLSDAAKTVNLREGRRCTALPGPEWWMCDGKTLAAIRLEIEDIFGD